MKHTRARAAFAAFGLSALFALALFFAGCPTDGGSGGGGNTVTDPTPAKYREMASISGGTVTGSGSGGVFINGRTVTLSAFKMAKHQTTWQLWKEVYDWAVKPENGYTFANPGAEGYPNAVTDAHSSTEKFAGKGTDSNQWTAAEKKTRPVTMVNWRDAIVWCNAYSEMSGKTPVYYTDATYNTVLKTSTNDGGFATAADTAAIKPGANGYRLPTEAEWEYAARGGNSTAAAWGYKYAGTNGDDQLGDYAWYTVNSYDLGTTNKDYGAHPVGTKQANSAGLYDMSGNVWEWCWDWYSSSVGTGTEGNPAGAASGSSRVERGGSWYYDAVACAAASRDYGSLTTGAPTSAFGLSAPEFLHKTAAAQAGWGVERRAKARHSGRRPGAEAPTAPERPRVGRGAPAACFPTVAACRNSWIFFAFI